MLSDLPSQQMSITPIGSYITRSSEMGRVRRLSEPTTYNTRKSFFNSTYISKSEPDTPVSSAELTPQQRLNAERKSENSNPHLLNKLREQLKKERHATKVYRYGAKRPYSFRSPASVVRRIDYDE